MNNIKIASLICILLFSKLYAQNSFAIKGKVTDKNTGAPLPFVNVYLSETLIGSASDINGYYSIKNVPKGKFTLVVSMIGYKPVIKNLALKEEKTLTLDFKLEEIVYNLDQIDVEAKIPEKWLNQLELFKKIFLGNNQFADDCVIVNETKLEFIEDEFLFKTFINEPLLVINNALGYKINCVMRSFSFNKRKEMISMEVYPGFTEIITSNEDTTDDYYYNREKSYTGSLAHFLTLLTDSTKNLSDEGFQVGFLKNNRTSGWANYSKFLVISNLHTNTFILNPSAILKKRYQRDDYYVDGIVIDYGGKKDKTTRIEILHNSGAEFDPAGYFLNVGEFIIQGYMAREGIATMLPRFYKTDSIER